MCQTLFQGVKVIDTREGLIPPKEVWLIGLRVIKPGRSIVGITNDLFEGHMKEATSVAVALSGTTGFAESFRVMKLLDDLGVQ